MMNSLKSAALGGAAVLAVAVGGAAPAAATCDPEPYVGSICFTAAQYCPGDLYIEATGQTLPITQYQALYALLGVQYGGDGRSNFRVPDLRGRAPVGGFTSAVTIGDVQLQPIPQAAYRGAQTVTLTINNLPAHSHAIPPGQSGSLELKTPIATGTGTAATVTAGQTVYLAGIAGKVVSGLSSQNVTFQGPFTTTAPDPSQSGNLVHNITVSGNVVPTATLPTGGNVAVSIQSPVVALRACIAVNGLFPPRP